MGRQLSLDELLAFRAGQPQLASTRPCLSAAAARAPHRLHPQPRTGTRTRNPGFSSGLQIMPSSIPLSRGLPSAISTGSRHPRRGRQRLRRRKGLRDGGMRPDLSDSSCCVLPSWASSVPTQGSLEAEKKRRRAWSPAGEPGLVGRLNFLDKSPSVSGTLLQQPGSGLEA